MNHTKMEYWVMRATVANAGICATTAIVAALPLPVRTSRIADLESVVGLDRPAVDEQTGQDECVAVRGALGLSE